MVSRLRAPRLVVPKTQPLLLALILDVQLINRLVKLLAAPLRCDTERVCKGLQSWVIVAYVEGFMQRAAYTLCASWRAMEGRRSTAGFGARIPSRDLPFEKRVAQQHRDQRMCRTCQVCERQVYRNSG